MSDHVMYLGRMIPKKGFRAFVYGFNDKTKLVNSWEEFEESIHSGIWFDSILKVLSKPYVPKKGKK